MDNWQKLHVRQNLPELLEVIKCNVTLLAWLEAKEFLTEHDCDILISISTERDRVRKFLDILSTRCGAYDALISALEKTKQSGAYTILKNHSPNIETSEDKFLSAQTQKLELGNKKTTQSLDAIHLFEVLGAGNLETISRAFELYAISGKNITEATIPGQKSLLHYAVQNLNLSVVSHLLHHHDFKAILSTQRMCDLLHSCVGGTANIPDAKIDEKLSIIESLVQERPELLDATDKYSCTPILSDDIHVDLLIKLIEKGADTVVYRSNSSGQIMLHKCCQLSRNRYQKLANFLVQKGHGNAYKVRDIHGLTPLHFAVQVQDLESETLALLSTAGYDFNEADEDGNSVLIYAITGNRSLEFIDLLIKHGADWKLNGARELTVMHFAAWHGNLSALEYFLEKGLDVNIRCANLNTPLHYAVFSSTKTRSKLELLKFLVNKKADVNARDRKLYTVLHHAVTYPHERVVEMIEYLMSCGANINAVDDTNCAVMNRAAEKMSPYLYDKLLHAILKTSTPLNPIPDNQGCTFLHWAVLLMEPLKSTLETFAAHWDINSVETISGNSVLFLAVQGKRSERCLTHLIELGADWRKVNSKGETILHFAALSGNLEAVKFFIKKGCSVNAKNAKGNTVLHFTLSALSDQQYEIVVELVRNGADLRARNNNLLICFEYALELAESGELDERIVKVLME